MTAMFRHPHEEELLRFLDDDPAITGMVAEHLEECEECRSRLHTIRGFRETIKYLLRGDKSREAKTASLMAKVEQDANRGKQLEEFIQEIRNEAVSTKQDVDQNG